MRAERKGREANRVKGTEIRNAAAAAAAAAAERAAAAAAAAAAERFLNHRSHFPIVAKMHASASDAATATTATAATEGDVEG